MIFDKIKNAHFYDNLDEKIKISLQYLQENDLSYAKNGKYEIKKEDIFIIVQDYDTKSSELGKWEAHRDYIDIQFIIKGREKIGFSNIADFSPVIEYDKEKDIIFLEGEGNFVVLNQGYFAIFTPEDAHMPGLLVEKPEYVKKAVVKIKV
ncbi:MAG: YhcH/YjgK/YiaL family protein [Candidatus Gastranaerophilaceae bacterium]|jgi:YhcH/YjgK/YiaL family protein